MDDTKSPIEKARDQGQREGLLRAFRMVRAALEGTGTLDSHHDADINAEIEAIRKRLPASRSK